MSSHHSKIKLFSFPFSGGNFLSYKKLEQLLPEFISLNTIDLPGHGLRFSEPLLNDIDEMANDMLVQIKTELDLPYAFFGHSLGALLAFVLTKKLQDLKMPLPSHLYVSGHAGPSIQSITENIHLLPTKNFFEKLQLLGGLPDEFLENDELISLYDPIFRADFEACTCFRYKKAEPFNLPISVFYGHNEDISQAEIETWKIESTKHVNILKCYGNHFFIYNNFHVIAKEIIKTIQPINEVMPLNMVGNIKPSLLLTPMQASGKLYD